MEVTEINCKESHERKVTNEHETFIQLLPRNYQRKIRDQTCSFSTHRSRVNAALTDKDSKNRKMLLCRAENNTRKRVRATSAGQS